MIKQIFRCFDRFVSHLITFKFCFYRSPITCHATSSSGSMQKINTPCDFIIEPFHKTTRQKTKRLFQKETRKCLHQVIGLSFFLRKVKEKTPPLFSQKRITSFLNCHDIMTLTYRRSRTAKCYSRTAKIPQCITRRTKSLYIQTELVFICKIKSFLNIIFNVEDCNL